MNDWMRYTEIELTPTEERDIEAHGPGCQYRGGQQIVMLAQTDTEPNVWGIPSHRGSLIAQCAGLCYQSHNDAAYLHEIDAICATYGAELIGDSYAQVKLIRLPYDRAERRRCIAALKRADARAVAIYKAEVA